MTTQQKIDTALPIEGRIIFFYPVLKSKKKGLDGRRAAFAGVIVDNELNVGIALCSKKDAFNRKKGRKIALGRALKHPVYTETLTSLGITGKEFIALCQKYSDNWVNSIID